MLFFDRLILAQYSTTAMNAAVAAGIMCITLGFFVYGIAAISEVFVGQYNGANKPEKLGEPVWQMIWLCIFAWICFIPIAVWGGAPLLAKTLEPDGVPYIKVYMLFGALLPMSGAIAGFFVGQGRTQIILVASVIGNVVNLILDIFFVFGVEGWIPSMGTKGAALATGIGLLVQVLILLAMFLSPHNRKAHNTHIWKFIWDPFWKCVKVGTPSAVSHLLELAAWSILTNVVALVSDAHITVYAVGQTLFILFTFGVEGLYKAIIAISSNYIGANRHDVIPETMRAAVRLTVIASSLLLIPLIIWPEPLIYVCLGDYTGSMPFDTIVGLIKTSLIFVWFFFIADMLAWTSIGVLTGAGDTKFVMVANAITSWSFALVPTYTLVVIMGYGPVTPWILAVVYGGLNALVFYLRYKGGKWKTLSIQ